MTKLDIVLIVLVAIFILIGALRGLIPQLFNLAGLILAYFLARPFGGLMEGFFQKFNLSPTAAHLTSIIVAGLVVYFIVSIIGRFINRQVKEGAGGLSWRNRMWGGIIGLMKGALVALAILFIIDVIPQQLPAEPGKESKPLSQSPALKFAHYVNPLPNTQYIQHLTTVLKDPKTVEKIQNDPDYQKLLANPQVQDIMDDNEIKRAIEKSDYKFLFHNEKLKKLAQDKEVRGLVLNLIDKALKARVETKEKVEEGVEPTMEKPGNKPETKQPQEEKHRINKSENISK